MVSDKNLAVSAVSTAPLVDVVDIAAIAAGLRKGSAVSGGDRQVWHRCTSRPLHNGRLSQKAKKHYVTLFILNA